MHTTIEPSPNILSSGIVYIDSWVYRSWSDHIKLYTNCLGSGLRLALEKFTLSLLVLARRAVYITDLTLSRPSIRHHHARASESPRAQRYVYQT